MQDPQIIQIEQERKPSLFYLHTVHTVLYSYIVHSSLNNVHRTWNNLNISCPTCLIYGKTT